mmetsp:Transcript_83353/g.193702  ORF Transcript_83353/g.193702 Transcript_83353/m.193702 type:complete len:293 (+) Transcript_83353:110-988(+)
MPPTAAYEAQHRAFLQKLQARNQAKKEQQEAKEHGEAERLRREQNFSVCFSGANARKMPTQGRSRRGASFGALGQDRQGSGWRRWEENTVEIQGVGGEVFALRPSGERHVRHTIGEASVDLAETIPDWAEGSLSASPAEPMDSEAAAGKSARAASTPPSVTATHRELRELLAELCDPLSKEENADGVAPVAESSTPTEPECEAAIPDGTVACSLPLSRSSAEAINEEEPPGLAMSPTSSTVLKEAEEALTRSPTAEELSERILKLPKSWRGRLMQLLEEAEAEVRDEQGCLP